MSCSAQHSAFLLSKSPGNTRYLLYRCIWSVTCIVSVLLGNQQGGLPICNRWFSNPDLHSRFKPSHFTTDPCCSEVRTTLHLHRMLTHAQCSTTVCNKQNNSRLIYMLALFSDGFVTGLLGSKCEAKIQKTLPPPPKNNMPAVL